MLDRYSIRLHAGIDDFEILKFPIREHFHDSELHVDTEKRVLKIINDY